MTDRTDDPSNGSSRDGTPDTTGARRPTRRVIAFVLLCAACLALAAGYGWRSAARRASLFRDVSLPPIGSLAELERPPRPESPPAPATSDVGRPESDSAAVPPPVPGDTPEVDPDRAPDREPNTASDARGERPEHVLLLRHTGLDESFGVASVHRLSAVDDDRRATPLRCDRLYFAQDRGVCLTTDRFYTTHSVMVFDSEFAAIHRLPLNGVPSRVRLSPDGRLAAVTVFVSGHSYADEGFSTETSIVDTHSGERRVTSLEEFEVWRDGARLRAVDFNFWGVTFTADSDRFYATLGTGGAEYLVEGRVSTRRADVVLEGVECPSLSPDQTRIAFKKRLPVGTGFEWRLHVIDLGTLHTTPLAETRAVDDQVEWLDDTSVLYAIPDRSAPTPLVTDVWTVAADGSGEPQLLLKGASSPAVLRSAMSRPVGSGPSAGGR